MYLIKNKFQRKFRWISIESAAYMENSSDIKDEVSANIFTTETKEEKIEEEHTPKLFSEDQNHYQYQNRDQKSIKRKNNF